jgi:hypothetical protein
MVCIYTVQEKIKRNQDDWINPAQDRIQRDEHIKEPSDFLGVEESSGQPNVYSY